MKHTFFIVSILSCNAIFGAEQSSSQQVFTNPKIEETIRALDIYLSVFANEKTRKPKQHFCTDPKTQQDLDKIKQDLDFIKNYLHQSKDYLNATISKINEIFKKWDARFEEQRQRINELEDKVNALTKSQR